MSQRMRKHALSQPVRREGRDSGLTVVANDEPVVAGPVGAVGGLVLLEAERALHADGDLSRSRQCFDIAFRHAELEGDTVAMAMAAVGLGGLWVHKHRGVAASALIERRLHRALATVDHHTSLALRLRARIAAEDDYHAGRHSNILQVLQEARDRGDPVAIAEAASLAHHCVLGPDQGELRHALATELIGEAMRTERPGDLVMGVMWRTVDLFLDGDPRASRCLAELRGLLAQKDHLAASFVTTAIEVMLRTRDGQLETAEHMARQCAEAGRRAGDIDATGWLGAQLINVRWWQGRIGELAATLPEWADSPDLSPLDHAHTAALAVAAAVAGQRHRAAVALAQLSQHGLHRLPRSSSWLVTMFATAEAASLLGDADAMAASYDLLLPHAHRPAMASLAVACFGSVHHALGVASFGLGENNRAIDHLRAAVRANLALGHWPAATLSRARLAQALLRRHGRDDLREARSEMDTATRDAARLGMVISDNWSAPAHHPIAVRGGRRAIVTCQRDGTRWQIRFGDETTIVEDGVGMSYLAILLANPGYDVPALELAAGPGTPNAVVVDGLAASTQPCLDEAAMRSYRARMSALRSEIDEYEAMNDPVRVERARIEYDWLVSELTKAIGLGGRARYFASSEERARVSVGKAIRRAIAKIATVAPEIGTELQATIQTGMKCSYLPR